MVVVARNKSTLTDAWRPVLLRESLRFAEAARGRRIRSRVDFATQVVRLPEGPHVGKPWRARYQPYAFHLLDQMDRSRHRKYRITGCVQSGKTTNGPAINTCWHLFERRETVVYGITSMDMARDKWLEEIYPIIDASPLLRQYLPKTGGGAKGGTPSAIKFRNGATLRFMSAHGRDDKRSAFTAPVVVKTEVDRYDEAGEVSREAPPVEQMEARTAAFGDRAFSYEECTVTTEDGRIWSELQSGTYTALHYPCTHCREWVRPMREHFVAVEDCRTPQEARKSGTFICPACSEAISEANRQAMLDLGQPIHRGQAIAWGHDGAFEVTGEAPDVDKFSFWWNAFDNRFWSSAFIAGEEWTALYAKHPEEKDLARRQFAWTLPAEPEVFDSTPLSLAEVLDRAATGGELTRGVVPPGTVYLSAGIDVRKTQLHYVVVAWTADGRGHVIDFGIMKVPSKELGIRQGVLTALRELRDNRIAKGYQDAEGERYPVGWTLVDGGWKPSIIRSFMRETARKQPKGWMMVLGRGQSEPPGKGSYTHPKALSKPGGRIVWMGDEQCYVSWNPKYKLPAMFANSDEWKSFVHEGLSTPPDMPGALTYWLAVDSDEKALARKFAMQLIAEKEVQKLVKDRGVVTVWIDESRRANHFLDCFYYACAAGHLCGVRVAIEHSGRSAPGSPPPFMPPQASDSSPFNMPDGRPFLSLEE
ncbi:MAG: phage terminase large subunit family protein [Pirellulales bacterium]|nr:phage terminase large subunit family protein [Pirellulales bacterium]